MSSSRRKTPLDHAPSQIIRGGQIQANYSAQELPVFRNNPLIEALPRTFSPQEATEYLLQLPPYPDESVEMSQVARLQMTETAREFFVPNGKHLTVYYAITNMILRGYVRRNPVLWQYWNRAHLSIDSFIDAIKKKPFPISRARGLSIVGSGGVGKSTTVEKILQSLPQVITHVLYKGSDFIMRQLVWVKLDCPRIGSLRELCINFFRAVDEILGSQYEKRYAGNSHRSLEALIVGMARVATNHCLGVLVIDEIQDLSEARSGGDITMVSFFVHLENAIGVPFCLIGTQDAIPLLSGQFRQARRVSEQGYITWDRMSEIEPEIETFEDDDDKDDDPTAQDDPAVEPQPVSDPVKDGQNGQKQAPQPDLVWKSFVETMWMYQYVKRRRPLKKNIAEDKCVHALYSVSKGIPAVVQTVFVLAQQRAILTEEETITPSLIHDTFRDHQKVIEDILGESRMKRPRELRAVGDLADLDQVYEGEEPASCLTTTEDESDTEGVGKQGQINKRADGVKVKFQSSGKPALSASSKTSKKSDKYESANRRRLSKDDLRNGTPKGRRKKYSKSPAEYL